MTFISWNGYDLGSVGLPSCCSSKNSKSKYTEFANSTVNSVYNIMNAFSVLFSGICWNPSLLEICQSNYYDSGILPCLDLNA